MTFKLDKFAWRIGMILIVAMPLLYILAVVAPFASPRGNSPIVQLILNAQTIIPGVLLTVAFGSALCLLVRIEQHLRRTAEKGE